MGNQLNEGCCGFRTKIPDGGKGTVVIDIGKKMEGIYAMDKLQRFKYLFPFYRMDINTFRQQMDKIKTELKSSNKDTDFVSID